MLPRRFVCLAIEDQPTRAAARSILDVGPAEDIAKECARCWGIVGINQGVDAGDRQTELLKSPEILPFGSIANQGSVHPTGDRN
jgi:hypothetical protein